MEGQRRRKVVHLTSVHSPTDARILHKECATLAQEGYEVVIVAPGPARQLPWNVRHRAVPLPNGRLQRFSKTIRDVYRAARDENADVYHFHDPELIGVGLALRARGARVIFDVHEDIALDIRTKPWIPTPLRPLVSAAATGVLRVVQRGFTAIVPATPSIAERFTHRRTIVVRNYPRLEELATEGDDLPLAQRPMTAVYLGSITLVRGVEQMVDAMAHPSMPPNARLLLAGEFEDEALLQRVSRRPGWSRVDAPGKLPRAALGAAMAGSRVGLIPLQPVESFELSLPTKLFEYMAAGLPIVMSKFLACRDIVERHECGIVIDPRDSAEIAEALAYLFRNPREAQSMGERGRQAVRGRYEWAPEGRSLCGLYAEIA